MDYYIVLYDTDMLMQEKTKHDMKFFNISYVKLNTNLYMVMINWYEYNWAMQ